LVNSEAKNTENHMDTFLDIWNVQVWCHCC